VKKPVFSHPVPFGVHVVVAISRLVIQPSRWFALLAIVPVIAMTSAATEAQSPSPPVSIDACAPIIRQPMVFPGESPPPSFMGVPIASTSSGMRIAFVNDANQVATLVTFAVNDNGNQFVIRDVGTFSPGVSIDHTYSNGRGQSYLLPSFITPHVRCRVQSVKFADGSVWRRGEGTTVPRPLAVAGTSTTGGPLSATPAQLTIAAGTQSALLLVQSTAPVAGFREHDTCDGIASVYVASVADTAATYAVKPVAPGHCTATVRNEVGASIAIPIVVH
jgi:hypothetical protein